MGVQKLKDENSFNIYHQTFLIDDDTDLDTLEQQFHCSFGDEARTPDGTVYIRHSDDFTGDKWVVKSSGSSGGGSSSDSGSGLVISLTYDETGPSWTMNKTFQEIWDAFSAGRAVVVKDDSYPGMEVANSVYTMAMEDLEIECSNEMTFFADTVNDYPVGFEGLS